MTYTWIKTYEITSIKLLQGGPNGTGAHPTGPVKIGVGSSEKMRRSQSEESMSTTNNPYEAMRKQRLSASTNMTANAAAAATNAR